MIIAENIITQTQKGRNPRVSNRGIQVKMQKKDYMQFSSIQKYYIHKKVQKCYITLFVVFVDAVVIGEWITLLKNKLRLFVKRLEMEKFYVPFVVE